MGSISLSLHSIFAVTQSCRANTKMMTHFHCCNNLGMIMIFIFFLLGSLAVAGRVNPLVEISSREDLMQLAGYGEEKLSTVLVSGTVLCGPCKEQKAQTNPRPVSGALVAISCHTIEKTSKSNRVEGTTDEFGDFLIDLPSHLHAIPNLDKRCGVKVLRLSNNSPCHHPGFTRKQLVGVKLSSVGNGIRTYTTESLHLTPKPSQWVAEEEKGATFKAY